MPSESSIGDGKELSAPKEDTKSSRSKEPPIPITVVQKVDEALRHGEVAGTKAHSIRSGDAEPDHVQIVGDAKHPTEHSNPQTSSTAEVSSIPLTIVDVVDSEKPSYGQVPGTVAAEMRKNDAQPDAIRRAPEELGDGQLHDKPSNYPLGM